MRGQFLSRRRLYTYQDTFAQFRVSNGEKAAAVDLGVVLGAGFVAETPGVNGTLQQIGSILPLDLESFSHSSVSAVT
ncbi:polyketide synthase [Botrytis cinerea]|uniref:Uncharacterized protein n=1 Tax=Botryotinia fuckeliana (strain T4) TaxID=999810 RepID=G2XRC6_BOTF4|nr:hypothetical protein BofuT4_uP067020.1 [Botrytis cinerea T4]